MINRITKLDKFTDARGWSHMDIFKSITQYFTQELLKLGIDIRIKMIIFALLKGWHK